MKSLLVLLICLFTFHPVAHAQTLKPYSGGPTPPLELHDLNGKTHNLVNYRGQVVMVQFWATYCGPCIKEMPSMQRLQSKLAGKPFVILGVNMGEPEKDIRDFLKKVNVNYTILTDGEGKALSAWKVFVAPTTFLIDSEGRIRYAMQGGEEWDRPEYVKEISDMLPTP